MLAYRGSWVAPLLGGAQPTSSEAKEIPLVKGNSSGQGKRKCKVSRVGSVHQSWFGVQGHTRLASSTIAQKISGWSDAQKENGSPGREEPIQPLASHSGYLFAGIGVESVQLTAYCHDPILDDSPCKPMPIFS
jgi:hypothetical protein